jgi:hypothetical protein
MHVVTPVIATATTPPPTVIAPPSAAVITSTSTHPTHASRRGHQQRDSHTNLDSAKQSIRLVHNDIPFAKEIKECSRSRNPTGYASLANRIINLARLAPQI